MVTSRARSGRPWLAPGPVALVGMAVAAAVAVGGWTWWGAARDDAGAAERLDAPALDQSAGAVLSAPRGVEGVTPTTPVVVPEAPHDTPAAQQGVARAALAEVARRGAQARDDTPVRPPVEAATLADDTSATALTVGQRARVRGEVMQRVAGEDGVQVVLLATPSGAGQPLVWSVMPEHSAALEGLEPGQGVTVDCLVQGSVMGRWLLADCHL